MGLFGDLDIANAQEVSYLLPTDTYEAIVSNFEVKPTKAGTMFGMNVTYSVTEGKYKGRQITEWQRVPHPSDKDPMDPEKAETAKGYVKKRLRSLGVAEDHINEVQAGEIIGTEVYVGLVKQFNKHKQEEQNQVKTVVTKENSGVEATASIGTGIFG